MWRPIEGFPDYDVNEIGEVRSWKFNRWGRAKEPRTLRPGISKNGYPLVILQGRRDDGSWFCKPSYVHRLVTHAFLGPCPPKHEVNHKNSNRTDARLENLEYVTSSANNIHAIRHGKMKPPPSRPGTQQPNAKLTDEIVRAVRQSTEPTWRLSKRLGVSNTTLWQARVGITWKHVA